MVAGAVFCFCPSLQPQDYVLHRDVRLVLLDVSVQDRQGGFVPNLTRDNFQVLENGKSQPITVFSNEDVPVTIGILVDDSGSMSAKRNEVLSAAGGFIQTSNPKDEIFVLNFNDSVTSAVHAAIFSDTIEQLRAALYRGVPQGRTALNDAVVEGLKQLELGRREKKGLVVISDGGDNTSRHTRAAMMAQVESSLATIYTIGLFETENPDRNPGVLKRLADVSGGDAIFPRRSIRHGDRVCQRIAKEIRTRYTIGYLLPPSDSPASLRRISGARRGAWTNRTDRPHPYPLSLQRRPPCGQPLGRRRRIWISNLVLMAGFVCVGILGLVHRPARHLSGLGESGFRRQRPPGAAALVSPPVPVTPASGLSRSDAW